MKNIVITAITAICFLVSCVPARKVEEIKSDFEYCQKERDDLKSQNSKLSTENTEQAEKITEMTKRLAALEGDTTVMGTSLRKMTRQYDKINKLNDELQRKLEKLNAGAEASNLKLKAELLALQVDLQNKEDELKRLETKLNDKQTTLDQLEKDLKAREARVNELEALIASKDEAVKALKKKIQDALFGFKDKGLTVEEKNGRIYVSMEAKLLFPSGSTEVNKEGTKALTQLARAIEDSQDINVLVEGHTDTDQIHSSSIPKDNWELSVLRGTAVVKIMLSNSKIDPSRLTAAGRGEFVPVDPDDKAKNRRIEVILIPNLDQLFKAIEQ